MDALGILGREDLGDPLRVVRMVGGDVQHAAGPESVSHEFDGAPLDESPLVMARFGPGVGKEESNRGERFGGDELTQHDDAVAADHAHIGQACAVDETDELCKARLVDLDGDHVDVGFVRGHRGRRDAGSAADLEHPGCLAPEECVEVDGWFRGLGRVGGQVAAEYRPQRLPVALLARRQRAAAEPEAGHARVEA